jgi:hypothetical protein
MNMIYVFEDGAVVYDGNTISEEEKQKAVAIEALPEPKKIEGKIAVLKANKAENRVYYEYMDEPKNPLDNEVEQLKQVVADLTELVLFGGAEE